MSKPGKTHCRHCHELARFVATKSHYRIECGNKQCSTQPAVWGGTEQHAIELWSTHHGEVKPSQERLFAPNT